MPTPPFLDYPQSELVFGLVGAVGTDLQHFEKGLRDLLRNYGYTGEGIRLSDFIPESVKFKNRAQSEYKRISTMMTAGTKLRTDGEDGAMLALHAVQSIYKKRTLEKTRLYGHKEVEVPAPAKRRAYIINSLKHPDEVSALRSIYGPGFYLIAVHCPEEERLAFLTQRHGMEPDEANELIMRDQDEGVDYGQQTRDVFHRADVFVRFRQEENTNRGLERFLDLVFGDPYQTPTPDEQAMFLAYASALRSGSLSRQVGAVVVSEAGEVIGVGANDVPCHGGGQYWPGESDQRDHVLGYDTNNAARDDLLVQLMQCVVRSRVGKKASSGSPGRARLLKQARRIFAGTAVFDITEFGRAVHAEMEAILSSARSGSYPQNGTLYCTTFPCHNCAKHIVAAGLARVVYVEPYPKSRARELHSDSIAFGSGVADKVSFEPFTGIGPRRYFDLFSMKLGSGYDLVRKSDGLKLDWTRGGRDDGKTPTSSSGEGVNGPRVPMLPTSYIQREALSALRIESLMKKVEQKRERPSKEKPKKAAKGKQRKGRREE